MIKQVNDSLVISTSLHTHIYNKFSDVQEICFCVRWHFMIMRLHGAVSTNAKLYNSKAAIALCPRLGAVLLALLTLIP